MVRPERRVLLAGEGPVRVSAEAPGSRPQPGEETPWVRAGVQEGRSAHSTAKATDSSLDSERMLNLSGVAVAARFDRRMWTRRDPTWQSASGKDCSCTAGRLKSKRARRESEGTILPEKACGKTRWKEGAVLWSRRQVGKREGIPETANHSSVKVRRRSCPAIDVCQVARQRAGAGGRRDSRSDAPAKGQNAFRVGVPCTPYPEDHR